MRGSHLSVWGLSLANYLFCEPLEPSMPQLSCRCKCLCLLVARECRCAWFGRGGCSLAVPEQCVTRRLPTSTPAEAARIGAARPSEATSRHVTGIVCACTNASHYDVACLQGKAGALPRQTPSRAPSHDPPLRAHAASVTSSKSVSSNSKSLRGRMQHHAACMACGNDSNTTK